jgi:type VI secretion system protein ImpH
VSRAPGAWTASPALEDLLRELSSKPWAYDFFAAVRRIEASVGASSQDGRGVPGFGKSNFAHQDPVRFCQQPSLAFAASTLAALERGVVGSPGGDQSTIGAPGQKPTRLFVNFMGLLGPNGPMPLHLTEFARDRERHHQDHTFARFLDLFNHRMVSMFYRAWAMNSMPASYDRRALGRPEEDRYGTYIASLIGMGSPASLNRDQWPDQSKLHYSGRLVPQVKNAEGLRSIIEDDLGVACEVREFVGDWLELPREYRCTLGGGQQSCELGRTTIVGARVWECQSKISLRLGAMSLTSYERLLPGEVLDRRLRSILNLYLGREVAWEARLVLRRLEVPRISLGKQGRIGYTTWLGKVEAGRDPDDMASRGEGVSEEVVVA